MTLREWRARATPDGAAAYEAHFRSEVEQTLAGVEGFRGAYLARRAVADEVELVVLTLWESLDAVRGFAGPAFEQAVVQPAAQAWLTAYDHQVPHYDVVAGGGADAMRPA